MNTTQQKKLFKRLAMRSLIRSVKKNGRAMTRKWASSWNPQNPNLQQSWEEAKKEVLK